MRVASNSFSNTLIQQLNKLLQRQAKLQNQVATGQRLQFPEDDPAAVHRVMNHNAESARLAQFQRNIGALRELAETNFSAIKSIIDFRINNATLLRQPEKSGLYETSRIAWNVGRAPSSDGRFPEAEPFSA